MLCTDSRINHMKGKCARKICMFPVNEVTHKLNRDSKLASMLNYSIIYFFTQLYPHQKRIQLQNFYTKYVVWIKTSSFLIAYRSHFSLMSIGQSAASPTSHYLFASSAHTLDLDSACRQTATQHGSSRNIFK